MDNQESGFWYRTYVIHPGIGVARIGNATGGPPPEEEEEEEEDEDRGFFIGPEVPDEGFVPPGDRYRDAQGNIRRQAARFRIYEYSVYYHEIRPSLQPAVRFRNRVRVREITDDEADVQWHVHLANAKALDQNNAMVVNDPGDQTIGGTNQSLEVVGQIFGAQVQLGTLKTDDDGRLLVLGGFGRSGSPSGAPFRGLRSPLWYDDVSDGPVRATIRLRENGLQPAVEPAWVIVGVPGFAHPIPSIVTLYDLAYDVARHLPPPYTLVPPEHVSFTRDIYSLLRRPVLMQWVSALARQGHSGAATGNFLDPQRFNLLKDTDPNPLSAAYQERRFVFAQLRDPDAPWTTGDMPLINGPLTVTRFQYDRMRRWSLGDFVEDWQGPPPVIPFHKLTHAQQADALDKAGLITTVGGAFDPGIEAGIIMSNVTTYEKPLRIRRDLLPGSLTASLSVPWQVDYTACGTGWWPAGRPNQVTHDGTNFHEWLPAGWQYADTIRDWWKLGFIARREIAGLDTFVETERLV